MHSVKLFQNYEKNLSIYLAVTSKTSTFASAFERERRYEWNDGTDGGTCEASGQVSYLILI